MNLWLLAILGYLGLVVLTFVPVALARLGGIALQDGGDGPEASPLFSEDAKIFWKMSFIRRSVTSRQTQCQTCLSVA